MLKARKAKWRSLENPAKIFPATSGPKDERVFRFACELNENVNGEYLQKAVDQSMKKFSLFCYVMRSGLFWNYLEQSDLQPIVREEYKPPISKIYVKDEKKLLFEVTYFKKRINLEIFHALSDGTGAMAFLRTIVYNYLLLVYPDNIKGPLTNLGLDMTDFEKEEDGFNKYYEKGKKKIRIPKYHAFQMNYPRLEPGTMSIISGAVPVDKLLLISREHHTTITVLLTAVLFRSFAMEMSPKQKHKPVAFMIPVNLRQFFPSESVRNFFGWIDIGYNFSKAPDDLDTLIAFTSDFFKEEITMERMAYRVNGLVGWEQNIITKIIPLELKQLILQLGNWIARNDNTAIFSNIGKVTMPEECKPYIRLFDVFTCTPQMELCSCSYNNTMTMTFTFAYDNTTICRNFFRMLTEMGLPVEITAKLPATDEKGGK